ncbi:hypothetical protein SKAU_G00034500 [Synaphobranchus kaupii]|uniref:BZIP domain-containing protein n=1 Tax=Synaphobranchus kaupii TaxID=118154 RepID=A0A9Q1GEZ0_SYNKA|nr:hypothetical protein SKAU_G00034500 [Synaphobranchus kaupii]
MPCPVLRYGKVNTPTCRGGAVLVFLAADVLIREPVSVAPEGPDNAGDCHRRLRNRAQSRRTRARLAFFSRKQKRPETSLFKDKKNLSVRVPCAARFCVRPLIKLSSGAGKAVASWIALRLIGGVELLQRLGALWGRVRAGCVEVVPHSGRNDP